MDHLTLENVGNGALAELFENELHRVLGNIEDPNTDARKKRFVTIKITFLPSPDREQVFTGVTAEATLAPRAGATGVIYVGREDGELVARTEDIRQREMFDRETGEAMDQDAADQSVAGTIDRSAG